ncbi:MAG: hypothetical protein JST19_10070 [Bacteroidetes bacterium]|nr:hypothetical protein [Bacteroidota bacterium]
MKDETGKYSVITFATNKMDYVRFALNCAESVLLHNDLKIFIVSNLDFPIPAECRDKIVIVPARAEDAALGIGIKLYIDEYVQTEHTLFIDSDCIVFGDLDEIFRLCEGMDVSVAGNIVPTEHWCGKTQAQTIQDNWGIEKITRFNGGLYYIRKSDTTKRIFTNARKIADKYDDYGFDRIKNKWINEEAPLGIAMTLENQKPIPDDGRFMTDLYTDQRPTKINVLTGARLLRNPPLPNRKHRPWYPGRFSPVVLHFGGSNLNSYPYKSQNLLLKLNRMHIPGFMATLLVNIFVHVPYKGYHWLRSFDKE